MSKRKAKLERKQVLTIPFDIDSIIKKVHVPVESRRMVSAKRYFSQTKNNLKNNLKIKIAKREEESLRSPIGTSEVSWT